MKGDDAERLNSCCGVLDTREECERAAEWLSGMVIGLQILHEDWTTQILNGSEPLIIPIPIPLIDHRTKHIEYGKVPIMLY